MIRLHEYRGVSIQQWYEKYSYRDATGQWHEFSSLKAAHRSLD
jgi:hypothetical protein